MSSINFNTFFKFCRIRISSHIVFNALGKIILLALPDKRYRARCSKCGRESSSTHSFHRRIVRDLSVFDFTVEICFIYRKIRCPECGIVVEDLGFVDPGVRVTRRMAAYIIQLSQYMSIKEISRHIGLNWKTVKNIHKRHLEEKFSNEDIGCPRLLAMDEISIKKRHKYLTVIINWESGRVLWVGRGRKYSTLKAFFSSLRNEQIQNIKAIAIDMWAPYIKAVNKYCPNAAIVFDFFHVVKMYGKVIDKIRNMEYSKANKEAKHVIKGSKFLLLKNKENLIEDEKVRLKALLKVNQAITTAYILKDYLKKLWKYKYQKCVKKSLDHWCRLAIESNITPLIKFTKTLKKYAFGIFNHCKFPIHTSRLEGINNKIKVIKRKAYGFHDFEYFSLVIKNAFSFSN